jgi:hypothetical protein
MQRMNILKMKKLAYCRASSLEQSVDDELEVGGFTMRFFRLIRSEVDVAPLMAEIQAHEAAWLSDTSRQDRIRVQHDTNTIFLRNAVRRPDLNVNENQENRFTKTSQLFPRAVAFMTEFADEMGAQLSRATIVRLKPHSGVLCHVDAGSYYLIRDRYHLVLYSPARSLLASGDETVQMRQGELWWFDNKQYHESYNESDEWRVHYIFDLLPKVYEHLAVNPILTNGRNAYAIGT